jgi:hypothetical protein
MGILLHIGEELAVTTTGMISRALIDAFSGIYANTLYIALVDLYITSESGGTETSELLT